MTNLVLIKLGGSVITDKRKPLTAKLEVIKRLGNEISDVLKNSKSNIVIAHGQGSFAHIPAAKYQTHLGNIHKDSIKGLSVTADMATWPNRILIKEFVKLGIPAVSFSPLSFIYSKGQKAVKVQTDSIENAIELGIIPVIYGDVIMDGQMGFCIFSGEKSLDLLASKLSKKFKIKKIIMVGDTDGVYDINGKTVNKITRKSFNDVKSAITGSKSTDVTGGMIHKVEEALNLVKKSKIETQIINGNTPGNLTKALLNQKVIGTKITT